jgi:hypothetical protein
LIAGLIERRRRATGLWPVSTETLAPMYVIDLTHYLDSKGAIAPERGSARKMADFLTAVVAHASDFDRPDDAPGPVCFKCRKRDQRIVETGMTEDDVVIGRCPTCGTKGRISNWQGTPSN